MEFFVTAEFERLEGSPFVDQFDNPLTPEMIAFVDFAKLPPAYRARPYIERCMVELSTLVSGEDPKHPRIVYYREVATVFVEMWSRLPDNTFDSMRLYAKVDFSGIGKAISVGLDTAGVGERYVGLLVQTLGPYLEDLPVELPQVPV